MNAKGSSSSANATVRRRKDAGKPALCVSVRRGFDDRHAVPRAMRGEPDLRRTAAVFSLRGVSPDLPGTPWSWYAPVFRTFCEGVSALLPDDASEIVGVGGAVRCATWAQWKTAVARQVRECGEDAPARCVWTENGRTLVDARVAFWSRDDRPEPYRDSYDVSVWSVSPALDEALRGILLRACRENGVDVVDESHDDGRRRDVAALTPTRSQLAANGIAGALVAGTLAVGLVCADRADRPAVFARGSVVALASFGWQFVSSRLERRRERAADYYGEHRAESAGI